MKDKEVKREEIDPNQIFKNLEFQDKLEYQVNIEQTNFDMKYSLSAQNNLVGLEIVRHLFSIMIDREPTYQEEDKALKKKLGENSAAWKKEKATIVRRKKNLNRVQEIMPLLEEMINDHCNYIYDQKMNEELARSADIEVVKPKDAGIKAAKKTLKGKK